MQAIYAYESSGKTSKGKFAKQLLTNIEDLYNLYIILLSSFEAMSFSAERIIELKKQKFLPSEKDLKPNLKFINNRFIRKIDENEDLTKQIQSRNLSWHTDVNMVFVRKIYDQLSNTELFISYMQSQEDSFQEDKQFILNVIEQFFLDNEFLMHYFGEIKMHWEEDFNDVVLMVYNTLKTFSEKQSATKKLPPLFKINQEGVSEDKQFLIDLFNKTIDNEKNYTTIISQNTHNWEMDRIAKLDFILLKMALCEFCEFPSIPLRVTLNEYIELAKYYSTPKSKNFVNGLLDNMLNTLREEHKINKQGRGLMG